MILYFDSYITDIPLPGRSRDQLKEDIRKNCEAYKMPKRIDIAKYTLASYALYPWSHVLIRYELEDSKKYKEFDKYIKSLFPKAKIMHKRSNNQKEYRKSIKILEKMEDDWIFYAPNNDHPIISPDPNISKYIDKLIKIAEKWRRKYKYVSIVYSHFSEFLNLPIKRTPLNMLFGRYVTLLEENSLMRLFKSRDGDFTSIQIVTLDLLKRWFDSTDMKNKRIIRAEDVKNNVQVKDQIIIAPKKEICAHFDGYEYTLGYPHETLPDQVPPLIIPKGFFGNKIKISYGYLDYKKGWVNINPCAKKYSFRDLKNGTDLKISLDNIPAFWQSRIREIDVCSNFDYRSEIACIRKNREVLSNPWTFKSKGLSIRSLVYWINYFTFIFNIHMRMTASELGIKKLINNFRHNYR